MTSYLAIAGLLLLVAGFGLWRVSPQRRETAWILGLGLVGILPQAMAWVEAAAGSSVSLRFTSFFGMLVFIGACWLFSENRRAVSWRVVLWGTALQFILAILVLKTAAGRAVFDGLNNAMVALLGFTRAGANFVFGEDLVNKTFAFGVLPSIIFFSALIAVLYYIGIMRPVIEGMAAVMRKTMGTSGAETLSTAANVFVGQTEAPLVIKPYIAKMTRSELMVIMGGGMANTAGGVLIAYVGMLVAQFPDIAGHLLACSVMTAPAAFVFCKLLVPETEKPETTGHVKAVKTDDVNVIDAFSRGASEGMPLVLNVATMLIAFLAIVPILNTGLGFICSNFSAWFHLNLAGVDTVQELLGHAFYGIAWLLGVPAQDCHVAGMLLGEKTLLNEFIAYGDMGRLLSGQAVDGIGTYVLQDRTKLILAYALCGFANIGSIGILLGALKTMAPERRGDLARLATRALVAGSLATFQTAQIAAILS